MTLKTFNEIISEIRYSKYDGKKAIGYDFYKIQEETKQKAIKWVKYFESVNYFNDMDAFSTSDPYEVAGFLKHFFNIAEEDLK